MTISEKAVQFMLDIARDESHGYDQSARWGPDYDCSSLVISAYKTAGVPLSSTYTGNMRSDFLNNGFAVPVNVNLATGAGLLPGDVLLNEQNHTAMYVGNGQLVHASGNEFGGVTGGMTGDQTGREICVTGYFSFPWDCVLRYVKKEADPEPGGTYIVQKGDSLWSIAERFLGNGRQYVLLMRANNLTDTMIWPGMELIIPGTDDRVTLPVRVTKETARLLQIMADGNGKEIGQIIDFLVEDAR